MSRKPGALRALKAEQQTGSEVVFVRFVTHVTLDGRRIFDITQQGEMPRLPANQDAMTIEVNLDARQLMQNLEPHMGPAPAKLWVPGMPTALKV